MGTVQGLVEHFTYAGLFTGSLLASLGVPIPEEVPIIAGGVLAHEGVVRWWLALPVCLAGLLSGDVVLYWVGWRWGEQVLGWRRVSSLLPRERAEQLKAAYRRHTVKVTITARHVFGLRAATFLTAGVARVPFWRFLAADGVAVLLGPSAVFGLAYLFTNQLEEVLSDVRRVERWLALAVVGAAAIGLVLAGRRRSRRAVAAELSTSPSASSTPGPGPPPP